MLSWKRERELRRRVIARDGGRCIRCGKAGDAVHHVLPRSQLCGQKLNGKLWSVENMCVLCQECHGKAAGLRGELLSILKARHGYGYAEEPWAGYVGSRAGTGHDNPPRR